MSYNARCLISISLLLLIRMIWNICNSEQVLAFFDQNRAELIINAAAYTAVDKAEEEKDLAWMVNQQGAENLAMACKQHAIKMVQISTDFVFSGEQYRPYMPDDKAESASVYGPQ